MVFQPGSNPGRASRYSPLDYSAAATTVSALAALRAPRGFSPAPTVLSRAA